MGRAAARERGLIPLPPRRPRERGGARGILRLVRSGCATRCCAETRFPAAARPAALALSAAPSPRPGAAQVRFSSPSRATRPALPPRGPSFHLRPCGPRCSPSIFGVDSTRWRSVAGSSPWLWCYRSRDDDPMHVRRSPISTQVRVSTPVRWASPGVASLGGRIDRDGGALVCTRQRPRKAAPPESSTRGTTTALAAGALTQAVLSGRGAWPPPVRDRSAEVAAL